MTYEQFKEHMLEVAQKYAEGKGVANMQTITRSNGCEYTGITLKRDDTRTSAVANISAMYEDYTNGEKIGSLEDSMIRILGMEQPRFNVSPEDVLNFDKVEDFIFPRLINEAKNYKFYEDKPRTKVADLSVVYVIRFADSDGLAEALVTDEIFKAWSITLNKLHDTAFTNLRNDKVEIRDMGGVFKVLSNKYCTHGAVECLNERVRDELTDKYIIPSSVHEVLLISKEDFTDVDEVKSMVATVNDSMETKDILSYNVYEYTDGELVIAE